MPSALPIHTAMGVAEVNTATRRPSGCVKGAAAESTRARNWSQDSMPASNLPSNHARTQAISQGDQE